MLDRVVGAGVGGIENCRNAELLEALLDLPRMVDREVVEEDGHVIGPVLPPQLLEEDLELRSVDRALLDLYELEASAIGDGGNDGIAAPVVLLWVILQRLVHGTPGHLRQCRLGEADFIQVHDAEALRPDVAQLLVGFPGSNVDPCQVRLRHELGFPQQLPLDLVLPVDFPQLGSRQPHVREPSVEAGTSFCQAEVGLHLQVVRAGEPLPMFLGVAVALVFVMHWRLGFWAPLRALGGEKGLYGISPLDAGLVYPCCRAAQNASDLLQRRIDARRLPRGKCLVS